MVILVPSYENMKAECQPITNLLLGGSPNVAYLKFAVFMTKSLQKGASSASGLPMVGIAAGFKCAEAL